MILLEKGLTENKLISLCPKIDKLQKSKIFMVMNVLIQD